MPISAPLTVEVPIRPPVQDTVPMKETRAHVHTVRYFYKAPSDVEYATEAEQVVVFKAKMTAAIEKEFYDA